MTNRIGAFCKVSCLFEFSHKLVIPRASLVILFQVDHHSVWDYLYCSCLKQKQLILECNLKSLSTL